MGDVRPLYLNVPVSLRWSHFLGQPAKVGSSMRMTHHEDAETFFG